MHTDQQAFIWIHYEVSRSARGAVEALCKYETCARERLCTNGLHGTSHHLPCVGCMDILRSSALEKYTVILSRLVRCRWAAATTVAAAPAHAMRCSRNSPVLG